MKSNRIFFISILTALLGAACSQLPESSLTIRIQAGIGSMTKVSTTGDKASFVDGDKISVYAWTGTATEVPARLVVDGVVNSFDGKKWTPAAQMLWLDRTTSHYFLGISPARTVTDFKADPYTLDPDKYAASDLLVAVNDAGLTSKDNPVGLTFDHVLAKLNVNLSFRNQWSSTPAVSSVKATAAASGTVDYLAKTLTAGTETTGVAIPALESPADGYALSFSGLMIPQKGFKTLTFTIGNDSYVFTNPADIPLVAGKVTVVNLIIGRDTIGLAGDITINDWTSQGAAIGGDIFKPAA